MSLDNKIKALIPYKNLLSQSLIGLEKEGLRVSPTGDIAASKHPKKLGSALTHPYITTDFAESLLEIVTPPLPGANKVLDYLLNLEYFVNSNLANDEFIWHQSMPCVIRGETSIPLAKYGKSNLAKMKTVYRRGLGHRYGRVMQTIAGIHFNYSYSKDFFSTYQKITKNNIDTQSFINESYMGLIRNLLRYGWIIPYLFGASPAICKSFLKNYREHSLINFNEYTLYKPYATSLRMGDIGYQNFKEDSYGIKANYNSLKHYINSLDLAINTECPEYKKIGVKKNGKYQQLNANILQIENEYYASVRPKQIVSVREKPINALRDRGIAYIEIRSLDINPFLTHGIDKAQINFLEIFILYCLLKHSPIISTNEKTEIDNNNNAVSFSGRDKNLELHFKTKKMKLIDYADNLLKDMYKVTKLFDGNYIESFNNIKKRLQDNSLIPSAMFIKAMKQNRTNFFEQSKIISLANKKTILNKNINTSIIEEFNNLANESLAKQKQIEKEDKMNFDEFLAKYFAQ